tara:strand:+ start:36714 stop:37622 length:909 start_codon:yes stop_codon:yes gene_type:complete
MLSTLLKSALATVIATALSTPAVAQITNLTVSMDGAQANAGVGTGSPATGSASMTFDAGTNQLTWNITWTGLTGAPTAMHFHGAATPNQNAGVQINTGVAGPPVNGAMVISAGQASDLLAGLWYLNLHSSLFPGGEIRGQAIPLPALAVSCDPASNHLGGTYAKLDTSSFGSGVGSDLHLECTDGPIDEFGFILVSNASASLPLFNGVLCLGTPLGRYNAQIATNQGLPQLNSIGQFDGAGVLQSIFGNATSTGGSGFDVPLELPFTPPGQVIAPFETWHFQCWFRDGASANFSNVLEATFS